MTDAKDNTIEDIEKLFRAVSREAQTGQHPALYEAVKVILKVMQEAMWEDVE